MNDVVVKKKIIIFMKKEARRILSNEKINEDIK